ncbi:hypothetical protein [uncultured Pontibacter sp.]|uniref:hypothetical protein n=1 Tax=uncultured Pontibacter sp. TaxID=453356 RepID=UPI00260AEB87|nr:hypothetical protein [uncultured Pontibacter sp.]
MLKLLLKTLVLPFYRLNTGLFLFIFFFFFGVVEAGQLISYHLTLIQAMVHAAVFMVAVCLLWLLYFVKCIRFALKGIHSPANSFLVNLQALPAARQWLLLLPVALLLFLPVLAYAGPVMYVAVAEAESILAVCLALYLLAAVTAGAWLMKYTLHCYNRKPLLLALPHLHIGGTSLIALQIANLLNKRKVALLSVKLMSVLVLFGFWQLNKHFDQTLFLMFFPIPVVAQAVLVYYSVIFTETEMAFHRNLPLPVIRVFFAFTCTSILLLLPEFAFILLHAADHFTWPELISLYLLAVAVLVLFTAILYTLQANIHKYMLAVLLLYFLLTYLMVLPHRFTLVGFILIVAAAFFLRGYRRFELSS